MNSELKPCPFCGGEAEYVEGWQREDGSWVCGAVKCCKCGVTRYGEYNNKPGFLSPEEESELSLTSIEAWNTRAERTCHKELMTWFFPATGLTPQREVEYFGCSKCGEWLSDADCYGLDDGPFYCSNCGCKVDPSFVTDEVTGEVIYRDGVKVVE